MKDQTEVCLLSHGVLFLEEGNPYPIYQTMAEDHAHKSVGECHPYREFEGMQSSI